MICKIETKDNADIEEVGIDDVVNRKGQMYLTTIYDLNDRYLFALLDRIDVIH